jgi:hypothetical protein
MARKIRHEGRPADLVKVLAGINVLEETAQQGFTVNIGISDSVVQVQVVAPAKLEE